MNAELLAEDEMGTPSVFSLLEQTIDTPSQECVPSWNNNRNVQNYRGSTP